jgi:hypothetical protein
MLTTADLDQRDRNLSHRPDLNAMCRACLGAFGLSQSEQDPAPWLEQLDEFAAQVFAI